LFDRCENTQGSHEVIKVDRHERWLALNIISASGLSTLSFSVDGHSLWVYEVDGRHIEPYMVHVLPVDPGNRYSVLVQLDKPASNYPIRAHNFGLNQALQGSATLTYKGKPRGPTTPAPNPYIDRFGLAVSADLVTFEGNKAVPFPPLAPAQKADETVFLDIGRFGAAYLWTINGRALYPHPNHSDNLEPVLFNPDAKLHNLTLAFRNGTWVDLVFRADPLNPPHPFHKHTNKVWVIGSGSGKFNYSSVAEAAAAMPENFNFQNPILRDGWFPPPAVVDSSWVAVRYQVVNPAPSFLHCHIQIHLTGGMALTIMEGYDKWPTVPEEYLNGNGITPKTNLRKFKWL
jgi:FtsP/CotA-like multicopper oxidase with cupredoxin domain